MMINKANSDNEAGETKTPESGYVDVAKVDVQCHLLIKDKDTGEILVNTRG